MVPFCPSRALSPVPVAALLHVLLLSAVATTAVTAAAAPTTVTLAFYGGTLLSGGFDGCLPTPAEPSCRRGLSDAAAIVRRRRNASERIFLFPEIDSGSPFVLLHPLQWAANDLAFGHWGIKAFASSHTLAQTAMLSQWPEPWLANATNVMSNVVLGSAAPWYPMVRPYHIDPVTGIAVLLARNTSQAESLDIIPAVSAVLRTLARDRDRIKAVIVVTRYVTDLAAMAQAVADSTDIRPAAAVETFADMAPVVVSSTAHGGALPVTAVGSERSSKRLMLASLLSNGTLQIGQESLELSDTAKLDMQYLADQAFLSGEIAKAKVHNPALVVAKTAMPLVRSGAPMHLRMCMAGECALGNLFADAMRADASSDFSLISSGGLRGPGWAAGSTIHMSDLISALPFSNTICTGAVSGATLLHILNASLTTATLEGSYTADGDSLLQVSGLRVVFDFRRNPTAGRILSVHVYDRGLKTYVPVDRLKAYTYAVTNYFCTAFKQFPPMLRRGLIGERPPFVGDTELRTLVANYLRASGGYTAVVGSDRLVNDTSSASTPSLRITETPQSCGTTAQWIANHASCVPCAEGSVVAVEGGPCVPAPSAETSQLLLPTVIAGCAVFAAAVAFIGVCVWLSCRSGNARDVRCAPTCCPVTFLFTDVQSSTHLWAAAPQSMSAAVATHHSVIRDCIARHEAYEVKTVGDAFMIAVGSAERGAQLACDIQASLLHASWPAAINDIYSAVAPAPRPTGGDKDFAAQAPYRSIEDVRDDPSIVLAGRNSGWHGLRVRIGMHSGPCEITFDEVARGYDYYGPTVNVAARVEGISMGGEVSCTAAVADSLTARFQTRWGQPDDGRLCTLRGAGAVHVHRLEVLGISRTFPDPEEVAVLDDMDHGGARAGPLRSEMSIGFTVTAAVIQSVFRHALAPLRREDRVALVARLCEAWGVQACLERLAARLHTVCRNDTAGVWSSFDGNYIEDHTTMSPNSGPTTPTAGRRLTSASHGAPPEEQQHAGLPVPVPEPNETPPTSSSPLPPLLIDAPAAYGTADTVTAHGRDAGIPGTISFGNDSPLHGPQ